MESRVLSGTEVKTEPPFEWPFDPPLISFPEVMGEDAPPKKKKRIDGPRDFKIEWEMELLFAKNPIGKPVCLICGFVVCTNKRFNIERHYRSRHPGMDDKMPLNSPTRQQYIFTQKYEMGLVKDLQSEGNPCNMVSLLLAQSKIDFSFDQNFITDFLELIASCIPDETSKKVITDLCSKSRDEGKEVQLMNNALHEEIKYAAFRSVGFSLTVHELQNFIGVSYITILVRTVDEQFDIKENFLSIKPVPVGIEPTNFGVEMLSERDEFDWTKLISLSTNLSTERITKFFKDKDVRPPTIFKSFTLFNLCEQLDLKSVTKVVFPCLNHLCRMQRNQSTSTVYLELLSEFRASNIALSHEAKFYFLQYRNMYIIRKFFSCLEEIRDDVSKIPALEEETHILKDIEWIVHLALITDLLPHIEKLRSELHNSSNWFEGLYSAVNSFLSKLVLFERQLKNKSFIHFSNVSSVLKDDKITLACSLSNHLRNLSSFVSKISSSLDPDGAYLELICNPFAISEKTIDTLESQYQLEVLEIRSPVHKLNFEECQQSGKNHLVSFWKKVPQEEYHALRLLAIKFIARFSTTLHLDEVNKVMALLDVSNKITDTGPSLEDLMSLSMAHRKFTKHDQSNIATPTHI